VRGCTVCDDDRVDGIDFRPLIRPTTSASAAVAKRGTVTKNGLGPEGASVKRTSSRGCLGGTVGVVALLVVGVAVLASSTIGTRGFGVSLLSGR